MGEDLVDLIQGLVTAIFMFAAGFIFARDAFTRRRIDAMEAKEDGRYLYLSSQVNDVKIKISIMEEKIREAGILPSTEIVVRPTQPIAKRGRGRPPKQKSLEIKTPQE